MFCRGSLNTSTIHIHCYVVALENVSSLTLEWYYSNIPNRTDAVKRRIKEMDKLYIVIPAYNEEENIEKLINDWYPIVEQHNSNGKSRLVIIDDGSKDRTYALLQKMAETKPLLVPITKSNGGHGATVLYGYHYALEHGADYIFQTDSDRQTLPDEFEPFWLMRKDWDMVIGWRKERQDGASRIFVTKTLKMVIKACFGITIIDANTPFRLMKAETMQQYINLIPEGFNLSNVLLTVIFYKKGCRVKYIPITFRPRQGGVNSINMRKVFQIGKQALNDFIMLNEVIGK